MTKDEALKMALEALENLDGIDTETECVTIDVGEEITAIREVFAQPEQEPVAAQHRFRHPQKTMPDWSAWQPCKIKHGRPAWEFDSQGYEVEYRELYTSPQPSKPWVGLTEQERNDLWRNIIGWGDPSHDDEDLMKAIEAKLKEKNA